MADKLGLVFLSLCPRLLTSLFCISVSRHLLLILVCLVFFMPGLSAIPPIDRDESRFAQASSQMLETGDFVQIRFQEEPRNKKPIAIYWLQAASAAIAGPAGSRRIWPYRIPSLLGAVFSVLLTFAVGKRIFDEKTGLLAAVLTAGSFLLVMEAHLATTDAVLLATVMAAQGALSKFYLSRGEASVGIGAFLTFWIAQAIGVLVKGPVTPMVSLLTAGSLSLADKNIKWLKKLRPLSGLLIMALFASPWMIAIALATHGEFFHQALMGDMLSKVASGQESHGFPPGCYLLLLPLTLWPASAVAGASFYRAWKLRASPAIKFCLAWIIPGWIVFELIPTKLPHYVLPFYPALCLLIAHALVQSDKENEPLLGSRFVRILYVLCQPVFLLVGIGLLLLPWFLEHRFEPVGLIPAITAVAGSAVSTWKFFKRRYIHAAIVSIAATAIVLAPALHTLLPGVNRLWLSRNVSSAARQRAGDSVLLCSSGYYEPSLVFLLGTKTFLTSPDGAAKFLRSNPGAMALIDRSVDEDFKRELNNLGVHVKPAGAFYGFNYSKGRAMLLRLYSAEAENKETAENEQQRIRREK